jgi:hypothetical protein
MGAANVSPDNANQTHLAVAPNPQALHSAGGFRTRQLRPDGGTEDRRYTPTLNFTCKGACNLCHP